MERLVRHRWWALLALGLALAALYPGIQHALNVDNSLSVWFLEDDPKVEAYRTFQETFGNDEVILVRVREPEGVFDHEALSRMDEATEAFRAIDGVARTYSLVSAERAEQPTSLTPLTDMAEGKLEVEISPLVPRPIPTETEQLDQIRKAALAHPLVRGRLVDGSGNQAMIIVQMATLENFDKKRDTIVEEVRRTADEVYGETYEMGGVGVLYSAMNELTRKDFGRFIGVGYLLMFVVLGVLFRSWRMVLAALGIVAGATMFALGAMGTAGTRLNMVTVILPTLIIVLGIADAVHFPVAYRKERREARPGTSRLSIVAAALRSAGLPCLMTSLTTMASFLALTSSRMAGVGQVGIYAAIGIAAALVLSLVAMAIALTSGDGTAVEPDYRVPLVDGFLSATFGWLKRHRTRIAGIAVVAVVAFGWLATRIEVDTYTLGYFPDDHRVVREHEAIEREWGPYMPLEYTVDPAGDTRIDSAEMLAKTETFADRATDHPNIGDAVHVGQLYQYLLSTAVPDHEEADDRWKPDRVEAVRTKLEARRSAERSEEARHLGREYVEQFVAEEGRLGRVTLTAEMMTASQLRETLRELNATADEVYGESAEVQPSGYLPLYASVLDYIVSSQIRSFGIAVVLVFLLMLVWMRSFRLALISMVPNFLPVLAMLATMALAGVHLNVTTASIAAIVIGIAIDDTIHFLHAWREAEEAGLDWEACLEETLERAGPAICVTTLILAGGFPVLMLASIDTVVYFGFLTSIAAVAALLGDLFVLPLLLRMWPVNRES